MVAGDQSLQGKYLKHSTKPGTIPVLSTKWNKVIQKKSKTQTSNRNETCKSLMPSYLRCVKYKWAFKRKHKGVYHSRLVACGYIQVPEVDFSKINHWS